MSYQLDTLGKKHQTQIVCSGNESGSLANKYLVLDGFGLISGLLNYNSNSTLIAVWFNSDGAGVQPNVPGAVRYIPVAVLTGDTATDVAVKLAAALDADLAFTAASNSDTVTATCVISGARPNSSAGDSGFNLVTTRTGTQGFTGGFSGTTLYNVEAVDPVYHPDTGLIYYALYGAELLIVDPVTDTWQKVTPPAFIEAPVRNGQARWAGLTLAPNGKLFMPPYESNQVVIIDPSYSSSSTVQGEFWDAIEGTGRDQSTASWGCYVGTLLVGDEIYCSPMDLSQVMVINTVTKAISYINIPGASERTYDDIEDVYFNAWKWGFGARGADGKLYFAPHVPNSNGIQILVVDPVAKMATTISCPDPLAAEGDGLWWGAAPSGGKIFFAPYGPTKALILDTTVAPVTKTLLTIPGAVDRGPQFFGNFQGALIGPDEQVLLVPARSTFLASIDPVTHAVTTTDVTGLGGDALCGGACLAPNGVVYTGPYFSNSLIKFATTFPAESDTTSPTVTMFTVPATSASLTVPVTALTALDDMAVNGYLITESSTPPNASALGWSETAPTEYTVETEGSYTLYAWAKDAAGNVSAGVSATVTVGFAPPSGITSTTLSGAPVTSTTLGGNPITSTPLGG